jgi:hypothetical protein
MLMLPRLEQDEYAQTAMEAAGAMGDFDWLAPGVRGRSLDHGQHYYSPSPGNIWDQLS